MKEFIYQSPDTRFQLRLSEVQIHKMTTICMQAEKNETGGILVGYYSADSQCATVTDISNPPQDSSSNSIRFNRGVKGLKKWLISLWDSPHRTYYLGEWHFHPFASPSPSSIDIDQMMTIARLAQYQCPEPLLIIIGGNPRETYTLSVHIFTREGTVISLEQLDHQS